MSLLKNELEEKISAIILCAGEGKRIGNFIRNIPKPLIELNNKPLLMHLISNLNIINTHPIVIITGHLGYEIEKYISSIKTAKPSLTGNLLTLNSGENYKKGPLYSFLSIRKEKGILKKGKIYLIIPGDTYFKLDIFTDIFNIILANLKYLESKSLIFYQKKLGSILKSQLASKKLISIVKLEKEKLRERVKSIQQITLRDIEDNQEITQILPIFVFNYKIISKIIDIERKVSITTIREAINYIIQQEKCTFYANQINPQYEYFDIDTKLDFLKMNQKIKGQ